MHGRPKAGSPSGWSCGWLWPKPSGAWRQAAKKTKANDPQAKRWETDARRNALYVSKQAGDLQAKARELVAKFGGPELAEDSAKKEPKTFSEAKDAGREALDALQTANMVLQTYPPRIAGEADAKIKADLQKQLEDAQQTVKTSVQEALAYFEKRCSWRMTRPRPTT